MPTEKLNILQQINKLRPLFSRRDKLQYAGLLVLMGIGALLEVAGIGAVPAFISTLAAPDKVREFPGADRVLDTLGITTAQELVIFGAVGFVLIFTIRAAFLVFLAYVRIRLTERHRVRLARLLFTRYMQARYEFHLGRNSAELLRNVDSETKNIITGVINPMLQVVLNGMMTICIATVLIAATPGLAVLAIAVVGGGGMLFMRTVKTKMRRYGEEARLERKNTIQAVNQGLGGFQDARVLGVEGALVDDFYQSVARYAKLSRFKQFINSLGNPLLEYIAVVGLMLFVLAMVLVETDLSSMVPLLGLFGAAIVRLRSTVGGITNNINGLHYSMASVDAVVGDLKLLNETDQLKALQPGKGVEIRDELPLRHAVVFDNVSYKYPGADTPAVLDVDLIIERGQSVGFVGATGSGKTTLINILLGLLAPQEGRITVDGVDIYDKLRGWQNNIGYIPQSIYLLDDTIRHNIAFGIPDDKIDDAQVWTAIRAAQLEEHVSGLPEGIETHVGEQGVRLSGGQRQRVGLARALYHNPDVLVMDEATSALDNETESYVMEALEALKGDRTLIMIAHRLSTVRDCDRLYFLKNGRMEARGTYEELCVIHGDFRRMAEVM